MELIVLLILAGVAGYFLAGSRFSKPIDDAGQKVADTTRSWSGRASDWWKDRFGKKEKVESTAPAAEEQPAAPQPAEKQASRRKSDESESA